MTILLRTKLYRLVHNSTITFNLRRLFSFRAPHSDKKYAVCGTSHICFPQKILGQLLSRLCQRLRGGIVYQHKNFTAQFITSYTSIGSELRSTTPPSTPSRTTFSSSTLALFTGTNWDSDITVRFLFAGPIFTSKCDH